MLKKMNNEEINQKVIDKILLISLKYNILIIL
jgi:hypothetical protein